MSEQSRLQVLTVPTTAVAPDPENARKHGARNHRHITASLRRFGQQKPIVVREAFAAVHEPRYICVAGSGTLEAINALGWAHVDVVVTTLTGAELLAYGIADNQTGLTSEWDFEPLAGHISALKELAGDDFDLDSLGFEAHDVEPFLAADWTKPSAQEDAGASQQAGAGKDPHEDLDAGDTASGACSIVCTPNQREIVDQAIERVRLICGDLAITEGRCVELIAADYLSGAPNRDYHCGVCGTCTERIEAFMLAGVPDPTIYETDVADAAAGAAAKEARADPTRIPYPLIRA